MNRQKVLLKFFFLACFSLILMVDYAFAQDNYTPGEGFLLREYSYQPPDSLEDLVRRINEQMPDMLKAYQTAGVAIAFIENGSFFSYSSSESENSELSWDKGKGFGYADFEKGIMVDHKTTLFQVASVSKPVTVWGLLRMTDMTDKYGRPLIDLNIPIDPTRRTYHWPLGWIEEPTGKGYLKSWHMINRIFSCDPRSPWIKEVTLQRLINHTSGTRQQIFQGYFGLKQVDGLLTDGIDENDYYKIPSTAECLKGYFNLSSNAPKGICTGMKLVSVPIADEEDGYSSGNYTVIQCVMEDVLKTNGYKQDFSDYMRTVLDNDEWGLGMTNSTFRYSESFFKSRGLQLAQPYGYFKWIKKDDTYEPKTCLQSNTPFAHYLFASKASAGFYCTAEDLGKFVMKFIDYYLDDEGNLDEDIVRLINSKSIHFHRNSGRQYIIYDGDKDNPGNILFVGGDLNCDKWAAENNYDRHDSSYNLYEKSIDGFFSHGGHNPGGWHAVMTSHPEKKAGLAILSNTGDLFHRGGQSIKFEILDAWKALYIQQ